MDGRGLAAFLHHTFIIWIVNGKSERDEASGEYAAIVRESRPPRQSVKGFGSLLVDVVRVDNKEIVGSYTRNYSSLFETFASFHKKGRTFALYSPHYMATRVMELPTCRDLGGEDPNSSGFCPVEYYIPLDENRELRVPYGFVSGCIWGDDSSWKIQVLDLRAVEDGKIGRDERFGYIHVPDRVKLKDAIRVLPGTSMIEEDWPGATPQWIAQMAVQKWFDLETGREILWEGGSARPADTVPRLVEAVRRLEAEYEERAGFIGKLRFGTFDEAGLERLLSALRSVEPLDLIDRRLVSLLWWLPWIMEWQVQRLTREGEASEAKQLSSAESKVFKEVERILGAP